MKIISRFKDSYDHISYIYGVDEKIVYTRDVVKNVEIREKEIPGYQKYRAINQLVESEEKVSIVVIVDKMYFVVENFFTNEERVLDQSDRLMRSWNWRSSIIRDETHNDPELILELTKKVGSPVYRIESINGDWSDPDRKLIAKIAEKTPRLSDIKGMVALLDPQQTYQEISYAITNLLNPNPDNTPPIVVGDKYKIQAAGFDLKQSFRHRK